MYRTVLTSDGSKVRRVYDVARERNIGMKFRNSYVIYPLRCCHISPDSVNGRRTDRKSTKNVYPVVKVVSVAMKVVAECVRSA